MHRTDAPGATVDNKFTDGDPVGGVQSTMVDAAWLNDVQENIMAVLVAAGVAPTKGRAADLLDSIKKTTPGRLLRTTIYINSAGTLQASVDGGAFANASSTFTALPSTRFVIAEGFGGGASGGGSAATSAGQVSAGSGGGIGGYAKGMFTAGFNGALISVGAGGAPGSAGADGLSGGTTGFGSLMSIPGGVPGSGGPALTPPQVGAASGGPGTAPSGGNMISVSPQAGYPGMAITGGYGGPGASTMYGVGGSAPVAVGGRSGSGYGSGSSGSFSPGSTGTPRSAVAAQGGILIICEYA